MKINKTQFDGGVAEDARNARSNQYGITEHFDVSQPHRLVPYRDMEIDSSVSTYDVHSLELLTDSNGVERIFALGQSPSTACPALLEKSGDIVTGTFAASTNGTCASGTHVSNSLKAYNNQTKLYFLKNAGSTIVVCSYDPAADSLSEAVGTIADLPGAVNVRPFVHPLDDILYFAVGQTIAKLDGSTFTASAVTIPASYEISDITDYGPFLAILATPVQTTGEAKLFLWGRDTSIVEFDEVVSLGHGDCTVMENVQGRLIIIQGPVNTGGTSSNLYPKIIFREYAGGAPTTLLELSGDSTSYVFANAKTKKDDDLYFGMTLTTDGTPTCEIWRCGFNKNGEFFATPDREISDAIASSQFLHIIGDVMWMKATITGDLYRTNDTATFTTTSLLQSGTFRSGMNETVVGASVHFEPLPSGASVTLKYRVNEATAWTTVKTYTTANGLRLDANADEFTTKDGKEWHLRIESLGGAVLTGYEFYTTPKQDRPYAIR